MRKKYYKQRELRESSLCDATSITEKEGKTRMNIIIENPHAPNVTLNPPPSFNKESTQRNASESTK
jgi:hypothetical protein